MDGQVKGYGYRCDNCGETKMERDNTMLGWGRGRPPGDPPKMWLVVLERPSQEGVEPNEWHLCGRPCLAEFASHNFTTRGVAWSPR
jgi:hypothetical protein